MANGITMSSAASANIQILQTANANFQIAQKRVSTGKMVFGAADDTTRYKMSETMLGRSRQISDVNNNISLALKTLEATDKTLKSMIGLVESAQNLIRKAQAEGAAGVRGVTSTANLPATALVGGSIANDRFSITSDSGKNFTYTFQNATTTWGEVIDALNSANIGVMGEFVPGTAANSTNIRFYSNNGKDFQFDPTSDDGIMNTLTGMTTPTGQTFSGTNLFTTAVAAPGAGETGFTVGYGGRVLGTKTAVTAATTVGTAASTLVFQDGNGQTRTLTYAVATALSVVMSDINNLNAGVKAELVNQTGAAGTGGQVLRLRNSNGGNMEIFAATGDFVTNLGLAASSGFAAPLSSNNALRLQYGVQYDAIIANLNLQIANNPVQAGRNLLQGQNMNVVMDEFAGNPITIAGINITAAGTLTMAGAGTSWTTDAAIQTSATQSNQGILNLRNFQAQFATFNTYMKERYDLNKSYVADLVTQGDELVAADMAEESANMTALQTRQQFAVQAFSMGSQNEQGLLRLLG